MTAILTLCTCPTEHAKQLATQLIEQQLAACVNMMPEVQSVYRWEGNIETATETLLMIKTTQAAYAKLEQHIKDNHPYDCPEIIAFDNQAGLPAYLSWLQESVSHA